MGFFLFMAVCYAIVFATMYVMYKIEIKEKEGNVSKKRVAAVFAIPVGMLVMLTYIALFASAA